MADLASKLEPLAGALLAPGEMLTGCCVGTWQKTFSGRMVAIAVAQDRIVVQPVDRRFAADGDPIPLPRDRVARVEVSGGGGDWLTVPSMVLDAVSVRADITTTDGVRLKVLLMTGDGLLGSLGGGEVQRRGVESLATFLASCAPAVGGGE